VIFKKIQGNEVIFKKIQLISFIYKTYDQNFETTPKWLFLDFITIRWKKVSIFKFNSRIRYL